MIPRETDGPRGAAERPTVSVIVPVYNDPAGLRDTLGSLTMQTYPDAAHEIVVVDNDSTDGTRAVARAFASTFDRVELAIEADRQSSYAARNEGIRRASGDVLAFVDADMLVSPTWLARAIDAMAQRDAEYVGCAVEMVASDGEESLAETYNRSTAFPIEYFVDDLGFAPTCCLLVRRSVIEDVGPFDPRLRSSGDREFGHRVRDSGRELHYVDDVVMYHPTRTTPEAILRKSRRIGRGLYQLRALYPDRYGSRLRCSLNPWPYLPPRLEVFRRSVDDWADRPLDERAGMYLLAYARKVSNGIGRLEEAIRRRAPA